MHEGNNVTVLLSDGKGGFNESPGSPFPVVMHLLVLPLVMSMLMAKPILLSSILRQVWQKEKEKMD
jgi:hypothetical protein